MLFYLFIIRKCASLIFIKLSVFLDMRINYFKTESKCDFLQQNQSSISTEIEPPVTVFVLGPN